jgi:hypothetical protein
MPQLVSQNVAIISKGLVDKNDRRQIGTSVVFDGVESHARTHRHAGISSESAVPFSRVNHFELPKLRQDPSQLDQLLGVLKFGLDRQILEVEDPLGFPEKANPALAPDPVHSL